MLSCTTCQNPGVNFMHLEQMQGPHAQPMAFPCFTSFSGLSLYQHGQSILTSHVQSGVRVTQTYYLVYIPAPEPMAHGKFLFILFSLKIYPLFPYLFLLSHRLLHYEYLISFDCKTSALQSCLYMQGLPLLIQFFC